MAKLLDQEENFQEEDLTTMDNTEEEAPQLEEPQEEAEELPEKYRGKSIQDLVHMHQEAEKAIGKQGSEVGELRKLVDQYIQNQMVSEAPQQPKVEETEDVDWFSDPDKALEAKLSSHPTIKAMEESTRTAKRNASVAILEKKHPDYKEILNDNSFAQWIKESKVRTKLFIEADQGYDSDAADELFTNWKERKALADATVNADKAVRKAEVKQASTGGARGSNLPSGKKKYRRADIINLMNKDPERYAQLADEILQAYREKRVI